MDNLLLPKRLDSGIEELKAVFPVRPQRFYLSSSLFLRDQCPVPLPLSIVSLLQLFWGGGLEGTLFLLEIYKTSLIL